MCGITGIVSKKIDRDSLHSAASILAHRGPDNIGTYIEEGKVGLGHRRLSIIDLSSDASQPMTNEDGTLHIVYNGEIYNYKELKNDLLKEHTFKSDSDTEVILHLYEQCGPMCVEMLNGMFAFAIWDSKKEQLFIARDRAGIKPLYYYHDNNKFIFASEIKSLFELGAKKELNKQIIPDFLNYQILIGDETLFKGIKVFPKAHCGYVNSHDDYEFNEYWQPEYDNRERSPEELKNILEETIKRQMISDVPVGTFLSGGLDSSIITAIASQIYSQQKQESGVGKATPGLRPLTGSQRSADTHNLKTFTAGFEGYEDEIRYAQEASESLGTEHHSVLISPNMFMDALPGLIYQYDQPLSFASSVALYYVSKLASDKGVKVILTGEGADELFAGYGRYYRIPMMMRGPNISFMKAFFRDPRYIKTLELSKGINYDYLTGVNSIIDNEQKKYLLKSGNKNKNHPWRGTVKRLYNENSDQINRLLYLDWHTYLQELLAKQDRMSMAASIESRVPFLDNQVIDFAISLSPNLKLNGNIGKYLLRKMAEDILPKEIIERKKIGFTVPLDVWFRGPLYNKIKEELDDPVVHRFFTKEYTDKLINLHKRHNCSLQIWAMLNFKIWYKQHFK